MTLPDPHAGEPAKELDPDKVKLWREALAAAAGWKKEAERLQAELEAELGSAYAGLVNGLKVLTYRPQLKWAESRIQRDYPDLVQHFMKTRKVFDVQAFRAAHPDLADKYQVRSFRAVD